MDGRRVVLGEVVGVEARPLQPLDLDQALAVDLVQPEPGHGLDVVEDAELQSHTASVGGVSDPMIDCRCHPWEGEPWPSAR